MVTDRQLARSVQRRDDVVASQLQPLDDRRRSRRAPLAAPALIDVEAAWCRGECYNVSSGGVAVLVEEQIPLGTRVELYFELPNWVAIETEALVVRRVKGIIGLRFLSLTPEQAAAIDAYCRDTQRTQSGFELAVPAGVRIN